MLIPKSPNPHLQTQASLPHLAGDLVPGDSEFNLRYEAVIVHHPRRITPPSQPHQPHTSEAESISLPPPPPSVPLNSPPTSPTITFTLLKSPLALSKAAWSLSALDVAAKGKTWIAAKGSLATSGSRSNIMPPPPGPVLRACPSAWSMAENNNFSHNVDSELNDSSIQKLQ